MTIDKFLDALLEKIVWLWLPFYALFHLLEEVASRKDGNNHKH
jgi:hypothetical protein